MKGVAFTKGAAMLEERLGSATVEIVLEAGGVDRRGVARLEVVVDG